MDKGRPFILSMLGAAALSLALPASCTWAQSKSPATGSPVTRTPAPAVLEAIRARVTTYWKIRMTTNLQACQPFYEPAFRAKYPPDVFARDFQRLNRFAPEFMGIEGIRLDPTGTRATVKTKLRTKPALLDGQELVSVVDEVWLLEGGEWWKAAEPLLPSI
jgi:hypothetical protein